MKKFLKGVYKSMTVFALSAAVIAGIQTTASAQDDKTILGAGSSFINPLFSKMFADYNTKTGIQVNYQSIGSGGGILQLTNKTVDFGASDGPLNDEQATKIGVPVLHIPQASGAVVLTYNLPGNNNLINLTPDVIADIFLGKIKNMERSPYRFHQQRHEHSCITDPGSPSFRWERNYQYIHKLSFESKPVLEKFGRKWWGGKLANRTWREGK